jgi:phenylacetate-CoA ligase
LRAAGVHSPEDVRSLDDLSRLPFSSRDSVRAGQASRPPYGTHLTQPLHDSVRVSESAGTSGAPLRWLDTRQDLECLAELWTTALRAIGVRPSDRLLHALPVEHLGRLEGAQRLGSLSIVASAPGDHAPDVMLCTPSTALQLPTMGVRLIGLVGQPGANIPSTRRRIEERFGARCADMYVLAELGVVGWQCEAYDSGIHLNEAAFIVETEGAFGDATELVLTSLGRWGMPAIRYRTGDLVRLSYEGCDCGRGYVRAEGGVLGRIDELLDVRGVSLLPSTLENVVRRHPAVADYRLRVYNVRGATEVAVEIEPDVAIATEGDRARVAAEVAEDLRRSIGLRLPCEALPSGTLPQDDPQPKRVDRRKRARVAS